MSYPTHLLRLKGHYYYKIKVPVDLQQHFPYPFIKRSFKTTELSTAKTMLVTMEYQTIKAFILLRSGMLPDDMVSHVVGEIVHTKQKARVVQEKVLSEVIKLYVEAKESG